jgi:hypothetical protein
VKAAAAQAHGIAPFEGDDIVRVMVPRRVELEMVARLIGHGVTGNE